MPSLQNGYISSLLGKPIQDPELANALMRWLEKHPELDIFRPEDLARISFPLTASQAQENQEKAHAVAEQWYQQTAAGVQASNGDLTAATSAIMDAPLKSNAEVTLAQAVSIEQQRRVQSDGSTADRLKEAANLYSICESRRQMQFEPEVDKLAKQEFQKRISELAQTIGEPAKHNANNDTAKGY
ncbi:MAG TPA: hypothetical protein VG897_00190 [Terriglobales bacterium]|nr:hypothetical protein [Terriglobales bacterium]